MDLENPYAPSAPLTDIQLRVLGCLLEKKETTPEQYPLTLNALRNACNQKTARYPVSAYTEGEVSHTLRELEALGFVREVWGARAAKYEHRAGKVLGLYSKGLALLCPLILRGPQTPGELKTHTQRLCAFDDLDDVLFTLERLCEHEPAMVKELPRQPGQKETRFAHLLGGEPDVSAIAPSAVRAPQSGLEARIERLEQKLDDLRERLEAMESMEAKE